MGVGSRAFCALVHRNIFIYRKRKLISSFLELFLPIALIMVLVAIKLSLDGTEGFSPETVAPTFPEDTQAFIPFSFTDYVTAIQAERKCHRGNYSDFIFLGLEEYREKYQEYFDLDIGTLDDDEFFITGIADKGKNWMVPFVKCDSRACKFEGEDARSKYCEYSILAIAPDDNSNSLARDRAEGFKKYIYERYTQLNNTDLLPGGFEFVKIFDSNANMTDYVKREDYGETGVPKIGLGVVFSSKDGDVKAYDYTIRVNSTNYNAPEEEARPATPTTPPTDSLFESFQKSDEDSCELYDGTPNLGFFQGSCTWQYNYNGALTIQRLVGDWIMVDSGAQKEGYSVSENGVQFVAFPTPEYVENGFYEVISEFAPLLVTLGLLYPVAAVTRFITIEKQWRQKELMKMMSVSESDIGWSWFVSFFIFHLITTVAATAATAGLYSNSSVALLFVFWLFTFTSAVTVFGMLISSFLTKSTRATLVGLLLFFVGYFLTLAADFETGNSSLIAVLSLHPVAAFSYGLQEIGRLEDHDVGVTFDTWNETDSPSGYTFQSSISSLFVASIVWGAMTWYLNRVIPSDFGQSLPWYFPFVKSYWCPTRATAPVAPAELANAEAISSEMGILMEPVSDALKAQGKEGRSIEICGLRKHYGEKVAVDELSLSMFSGQVTALLGQNGAGKTTTINILTGMVAPTAGHAIVAGKNIHTQMQQIRQEVGICLQHDCLFPLMTVEEHIQFFARIKGACANKSKAEAEASIKTSIEDVALLEKRNTLASNLSGGMQRKLSVAIAFCGDSKTVLLDEPTSGMDPFSRRFTWNVIRQYRQDRCIILTTHNMDEADILGDRIAIMAEGRLRCAGSPLFLKKSYGVGYQLTIEKKPKYSGRMNHDNTEDNIMISPSRENSQVVFPEMATAIHEKDPEGATYAPMVEPLSIDSNHIDRELKTIVTDAVHEATVLSNVGTELSFQLPIGASSEFWQIFDALDDKIDNDEIITYGVGITTMEEVFLMVARGETGEQTVLASSSNFKSTTLAEERDKLCQSRMDLEEEGLFYRHVRALFHKRAMNFKRDKKAWCCSTVLPSFFVLLGLLIFKYAAPSRDLDALTLTLDDYNTDIKGTLEEPRNPIPFSDSRSYTCQPGLCSYQEPFVQSEMTGEFYGFCGYSASIQNVTEAKKNCSISQSTNITSRITEAGAEAVPSNVSDVKASSHSLFDSSAAYKASHYGALYFSHELASKTSEGSNYCDEAVDSCKNRSVWFTNYTDVDQCEYFRGLGYVVSYNFTAFHASMLYQALADEAIVTEALDDDDISITATIHPLPITKIDNKFGEAEDAFMAWFLMVLSFPFIVGAFGTFVVAERLSKAKHLQTVAGVKPSAYWLSTYIWDIINYQFLLWITVVLILAFGVDTFITTNRGVIGGVITTLLLFGPAGAGFTYCVSFLFNSPSMCNLFVIIFNFVIGMAGPMVSFILRLIGEDPGNPKDNLVLGANILEWLLRPIPSFCFGKALFNTINIEVFRFLEEDPHITVWHPSVLLWEVIFLFVESILYILLAIQIDKWSANPRAVSIWKNIITFKWICGTKYLEEGIAVALPEDEDVATEAERVTSGNIHDDLIVVDQMTKQYPNGKVAVNNVSYGIPRGECFGLLGINGAGKTTIMAMLTGEFPPTSGDATLAGFSVTKEPEKTRRRIGYCPQFDAHFQNMTGREHVELYASVKGVPLDLIKDAAKAKLEEVGLSEFDSNRLSMEYSGGMKRKLSVACAMVGQPQIVMLDEPTTGMDPVARRDLWEVISDMVVGAGLDEEEKASVILTTHSMEEAEALCPRIAIMANGKLRCLGSAQHLKTRFGQGYQVELKLKDVEDDDADYQSTVSRLLLYSGSVVLHATEESKDEEVPAPINVEEVFLSLQRARDACEAMTGDSYLSSMLTSTDPTGYVVWKSACSAIGVPLDELADFVAEELRMKKLKEFFETTYANSAVLRERQENKARYEVASEGLKISSLFSIIEEKKEELLLSDYGVSQTSLEQVFNMHAAEAERLKQGTVDA